MKRLGALAAIVLAVGTVLSISAISAVADGGTTCAGGSGLAKFSPGLSATAGVQNIVVKGALTGCTGSAVTDAALLVHLPRGTALLSCDSLTTGSPDLLTGKAIVKWPSGAKNSQATVTATLTGANNLHITGAITKGSFTGLTLTTDVALTAQFKTFPPGLENPPASCSQKNRLKKAAYSSSAFAIA